MRPDPLPAVFESLVEADPAKPLVVAGDRRATLGEIDGLSHAAAITLAARTAPEAGEPVGLQARNGPGFLAALVALRRAGMAPILLDPRIRDAERDRVAEQVGGRFVLRCRAAWPRDGDDFELVAVRPQAEPAVTPAETAVVKLTSGSTGAARGIATSTESLLADERQLFSTMSLRTEDRLLAAIPFSHSYGLSSLVTPALLRGMTLILPDSDDPFAPLQAAVAASATVFPTVPAYLGALSRLAQPPALPPSLRLVLSAGAVLPGETSDRFYRRYGLPVHVFYGSSETGGICYDREGGAAERGTVGAPVDGVSVELADDGRVVVRSKAVATGYLPDDPARLSAGRFVTDDLAGWRAGELALHGRVNELINVHGRKVNPREVEEVIVRLAQVEDALVTAAPASGADEQVRAIVACRPGSLSARRVIAHCRRHLSDYKTPRSVIMVPELPRTGRGKIDRAALDALPEGGLEPTAVETGPARHAPPGERRRG